MDKKKKTAKTKTAKKSPKPAASKKSVRKPSIRQLEKLDREILSLLNRRAELTAQRALATDSVDPFSADAATLRQIAKQSEGSLPDSAVRAIFRELLSGSKAIAQQTRVAYLGPEYTYSHLAAIEGFGQSADLIPVGTIATVFAEVEQQQSAYGIVPIENSTDGGIVDTLECLVRSSVKICGEVPLHIHHCLLGTGGPRKDIRRVFSKPQALSQCRNWLSKHLPDAELIGVASTTEAARLASTQPNTAAIASKQAGTNHSLSVLASNIEDNPDNATRFAILGPEASPRTGNDKTSLVFEISHKPGALADSMAIFKRQRLNMTWIESFPMPGQRGRYLFFVEFLGHLSDLRVRRGLASLEKKTERLTVLGSYAQADPIG